MRTIIIDDEPNGVKSLSRLLEKFCPEVEVIATANSAKEGISVIYLHHPDLVFLDIQMPFESGFDLLKKIPVIDFEVIFTTAHSEHAIKAIKINALDYLLKPVDAEELQAAVFKAKKRVGLKAGSINSVKNNLEGLLTVKNKKLAISDVNGISFVEIDSITRCSAESNYTNIYLVTGEKITVSKTLKEYEELLVSHDFFRVHNSHLVNLKQIKKYMKGDGGNIIMSDGSTVEISKRKKQEFLTRLGVE